MALITVISHHVQLNTGELLNTRIMSCLGGSKVKIIKQCHVGVVWMHDKIAPIRYCIPLNNSAVTIEQYEARKYSRQGICANFKVKVSFQGIVQGGELFKEI